MGDLQFAAFFALLAVIGLSSVSLLFALAWDLWQYGMRGQR